MVNLYVIAEDSRVAAELCPQLGKAGYNCTVLADAGGISAQAGAVLLENGDPERIGELSRKLKQAGTLPIIALLHTLDGAGAYLGSVDDFILSPWNAGELELRLARLLGGATIAASPETAPGTETIHCGDMLIDMARYEVSLAGRPVALTFKEYELLRFLAGNPERVFTREVLLDKVWGYDYYGGDRTIDVHIQRLRTKIQGSTKVQIETVRNIGYRLRAECA